jgi:pyruvate dehydrogenase E1 component alpha subunit
MGTAVERASAVQEVASRAQCYDIETEQVDGMDVMACRDAAERAYRRARRDKRPRFIEAITYRYRGHSMADPGTYRTRDEIDEWRKRDPIERFRAQLEDEGIITSADFDRMNQEIEAVVQDSVDFAESSPEPTMQLVHDLVYAKEH